MDATRQDLLINAELSPAQVRDMQRQVAAGKLHRISRGIATPLPQDEWPALLLRHKVRIAAALMPGSVVGFRSAFDGMAGNTLHLSYTHGRRVELPGLRLVAFKAPAAMEGDRKIGGYDVYFPSQARVFLDNLTRNEGGRNVTTELLEERLVQIHESAGEDRLRELRDQIESLAPKLGRERQAQHLGQMIGAILGTRPAGTLSSRTARAVASACDPARVERFDALVAALRTHPLPRIKDVAPSGRALTHFAFLESYFSNFIEGTRFEISEARAIVLEGRIPEARPKDSHDVIGVFRQIVNPAWRLQTLATTEGVLTQLAERHRDMMQMRPETSPGEFKLVANQAGNTAFVLPKLVRGTLLEGAKRLHDLEPGLARALYAMFLVAEVHPFDDGNGRLARLVMNAELSQAHDCRIIIPTLYRETYLDCLRVLTRQGDPAPFIKAMTFIQQWTASFEFESLDDVISIMRRCNAFEESLVQYRLLKPADAAPPTSPAQ